MGIPTYFSHIVKTHRTILQELFKNKHTGNDTGNDTCNDTCNVSLTSDPNNRIDNLYMDCNSIVYDVLRQLTSNSDIKTPYNQQSLDKFESLLCIKTAEKIHAYIDQISPRKTVMLAFDGIAPCAKMEQQRSRRYKSNMDAILRDKLGDKSGDGCISESYSFSSISITPGTNFMNKLSNTIKQYFSDAKKFNLDTLIVSCSDEIGEGEHKIFEYIRANASYHTNTTTVVYGLDADLIMLTLNHLHISKQIYLFRETPEFIKSIDSSLEPNKLYVLNIPELGDAICAELCAQNVSGKLRTNIISDYILMCFMLGNDFLPHFPGLNIRTVGHATLMSAYMSIIRNGLSTPPKNDFIGLTDCGRIVWKNVRKFIGELARTEVTNINKDAITRDKMSSSVKRRLFSNTQDDTVEQSMDRYLNMPLLDRNIEKFINPTRDGWQRRYYNTLLRSDNTPDRVSKICKNYIEGLEWTLLYYSSGCVDWRWTYQYSYPPTIEDLYTHTPYFDTQFLSPKEPNPVSAHVQLSYVLPRRQLNLLPEEIRTKLLSEMGESYPDECEIMWAYCRYIWEAHAELPMLDINRLCDIVSIG